ncbi:hypothetical protein FACS1894142_2210 [Spirochaetia bacterium]|nr:hypothetical protein FACS1894142_2210 [Spirochaetia bacterium]
MVLALRRPNCIAWVEDPLYRYGDQVIEGRIRLDPHGGYAAAGFMFRMIDEGTYYSALVSSKGYFRLDVLRNGEPLPLLGWTEVTASPAAETDLTIIAYGSHLLLVINGGWAAEINDSTIPSGRLCFMVASYEASGVASTGGAVAEGFLEALSVESRPLEVGALYEQWSADSVQHGPACFRLAETFTAMGRHGAALTQLQQAWEQPGYERTQRELLLACRLSLRLGLMDEADRYSAACYAMGTDSPEGRDCLIERAQFLYMQERHEELKAFGEQAVLIQRDEPIIRTLLGHAYWQLGDYEKAAAAYERAFELDGENGLPAKNAANIYELLDRRDEALNRYLKAGRVFLSTGNYDDLGALIPKLLSLGAENWEARALAGKWAFGIEDWDMVKAEFAEAEQLRERLNPEPPPDPALIYLNALLLIRDGKRQKAITLLEEAAARAPDYGLFHFKLAECRFLLNADPHDPKLMADLDAARALSPDDGWVANLAAQIALSKGDLDAAARYLERAVALLGDVPAIRVNRGLLYYLQGSLDRGLAVLASTNGEDPDGVMANCAGNLLVRAGRHEEAEAAYQKALSIVPDNVEYLSNRASCLIELGRWGEADDILAHAHRLSPSPEILEQIAYIAAKKGEFQRAEAACRAALELERGHIPSLFSLGWLYASSNRWDDAREIVCTLDELALTDESAARREELRQRLEDALTRVIPCASCTRSWRVPKNPEPVPTIRLFAMPPDEFPAGTCPSCGSTYCIECGKKSMSAEGRFHCPICGKPLKLIDEGLKRIVHDWAQNMPL